MLLYFLSLLEPNKTRRYKKAMSAFLEKHHATLLEFKYDKWTFGNLYIVMDYKGHTHKIVTDRGEIYINDKFVSDASYTEKVFDKVLEIIEFEILRGIN